MGAWVLGGLAALAVAAVGSATEAWVELSQHQDIYLTAQGPLQGHLDNHVLDPGFAHEPNTREDLFPGAVARSCGPDHPSHVLAELDFRGACNVYSGHAEKPTLFADLQPRRVVNPLNPTAPLGGLTATPLQALHVTHGDFNTSRFRRSLEPGAHVFKGVVGYWHDLPHTITEHYAPAHVLPCWFLNLCTSNTYSVAPDGWIGDVVQTTGQWRLAGYGEQECWLHGEWSTYPSAHCNPYHDGHLSDPHDYVRPEGEFLASCKGISLNLTLRAVPTGNPGVFQAMMLRNYTKLFAHPGSSPELEGFYPPDEVALRTSCKDGIVTTRDMLFLDVSLGFEIVSRLKVTDHGKSNSEPPEVVDVDIYPAIVGMQEG